MSWMRSEEGDGVWRGLWRRPSTWLLVLALLLFSLQLIPTSGIFLMFIGGSFWTGLLIVGFFIAIACEAMLGLLPRIALLLPAGALAAFYATAVLQRVALALIGLGWSQANPVGVIAFDPGLQDLVIDFRVAEMNDERDAAALIAKSELPVVYVAKQRRGHSKVEEFAEGRCVEPAVAWTVEPSRFFGIPGINVPVTFCLTREVTPLRPVVAATREVHSEQWWGGEIVVDRTSVSKDGQVNGTFTSGTAEVFGWNPLPLVGCSLVSGGPNFGWRCGVVFSTESVTIEGAPSGHSGDEPIAIMLGLKSRPEA